jgi:hypothetical protein
MTIGLFGTCGNSTWRKEFIEQYEKAGIDYFNPQVDDWNPDLAEIEAAHLANDEIILFPVLAETSGLGSLGEVGFSILQAIRMDSSRNIIVMIDKNCTIEDESVRKESIRARALVIAHLRKLKYPNVFIVEYLIDMFRLSRELHAIEVLKKGLDKYRM